MHEDDARMIRRFAIKRAQAHLQAGGSDAVWEAKAWIGVAVIAGADKGDLAVALRVTEEAADEGVRLVREFVG
jgi:hypothetical protein